MRPNKNYNKLDDDHLLVVEQDPNNNHDDAFLVLPDEDDDDVLILSIGNTHIRWFYRKSYNSNSANRNSSHLNNFYWKTKHIPKHDSMSSSSSSSSSFDIQTYLHDVVLNRFHKSESKSQKNPLKIYVSSVVPQQLDIVRHEFYRMSHGQQINNKVFIPNNNKLSSYRMITLKREDFMQQIRYQFKLLLDNNNALFWDTLGVDRLCGLCGAYAYNNATNATSTSTNIYSDNDILVIDGGTCSTFIAAIEGHIVGGAILPGINQKLEGLRIHTPCLPHITYDELYNYAKQHQFVNVPVFDKGTRPNLYCGIIGEFRRNFEGIIDSFLSQVKCMERFRIVITGGDGQLLYALLTGKEVLKPVASLHGSTSNNNQGIVYTSGRLHGRSSCLIIYDEFLLEHGIYQVISSPMLYRI